MAGLSNIVLSLPEHLLLGAYSPGLPAPPSLVATRMEAAKAPPSLLSTPAGGLELMSQE